MSAALDIAVVGCGHMGNHHLRTVMKHSECRLVAAVDLSQEQAVAAGTPYGVEGRVTVPEGVDAVIIACTTDAHVAVARPLLDLGLWCLIEKPIAATSFLGADLVSDRLAVGQIERFNPAVRAAGKMTPHYVEAHRLGTPTGRSVDIDVIMDLMIHDLDLLLSLSQGEVEQVDAIGVDVVSGQTDTCSARIRMSDGVTASLVASRVSKHRARTLRCYEEGRYSYLDLASGNAFRNGRALDRDGGEDALTAQLTSFVGAVKGRNPIKVTSQMGLDALGLAERVQRAVAGELNSACHKSSALR